MIDIKTGQIKINDNSFYYNMTFTDSLIVVNAFKFDILDYKNGYKWILLKEVKFDEFLFHFGLCFKDDLLNYINIGFSTMDELNKTWNEWSKENESRKEDLYEKWLTDNFGLKRDFEWGRIETFYDSKGGTSGMLLKYK